MCQCERMINNNIFIAIKGISKEKNVCGLYYGSLFNHILAVSSSTLSNISCTLSNFQKFNYALDSLYEGEVYCG